jgi:hypothetical protein
MIILAANLAAARSNLGSFFSAITTSTVSASFKPQVPDLGRRRLDDREVLGQECAAQPGGSVSLARHEHMFARRI